jgi:hypothetical protein
MKMNDSISKNIMQLYNDSYIILINDKRIYDQVIIKKIEQDFDFKIADIDRMK